MKERDTQKERESETEGCGGERQKETGWGGGERETARETDKGVGGCGTEK